MQAMSVADLEVFLDREFPQLDRGIRIEEIGPDYARLRLLYDERHLRPGGTISGPALMTLADAGVYVALLAQIGPVALAVTTSLTINFLRKPERRDVIAEIRLLKRGRRLVVGQVEIRSKGAPDLVAHAVLTYSVPPEARAGAVG